MPLKSLAKNPKLTDQEKRNIDQYNFLVNTTKQEVMSSLDSKLNEYHKKHLEQLEKQKNEFEKLKEELKTEKQAKIAKEYSKFYKEQAEGEERENVMGAWRFWNRNKGRKIGYKQIYQRWQWGLITFLPIIFITFILLEFRVN